MPCVVPAFPGISRLSCGDWSALEATAKSIGTTPECLAAVISMESRFNPAATNVACLKKYGDPDRCATGIIQFTPGVAKAYGTSPAALRAMSFEEQLPFVRRFYSRIEPGYDLTDCGNLYLATFAPAALGSADSDVLYRKDTHGDAYALNKAFDTNRDGTITAGEVRAWAAKRATAKGTIALRDGPSAKGDDAGGSVGLMGLGAIVVLMLGLLLAMQE